MDSSALGVQVPLVFFYRGETLPAYAKVSLERARKSWGSRVVVLHDATSLPILPGVDFVRFSSWYDSRRFDELKRKSHLDESFRSGFWFHAIERFFVLEQWSIKFDQQRFAHAELDVDIRCSDEIATVLDDCGSGLFYPFGSDQHAGASFFYSNSLPALAFFVKYLASTAYSSDEMHALWNFGIAHPQRVHVLPSHTIFDDPHPDLTGLSLVSPALVGGLFDVQPFGTWLLGQDPRNSPLEPDFNHFLFEEIGPSSLSHLHFSYDPIGDVLSARSRVSDKYRVLALHVHSKRFSLVRNRLILFFLVFASNFRFRLPLGPRNFLRFVLKSWKKPIDLLYLFLRKRRSVKR